MNLPVLIFMASFASASASPAAVGNARYREIVTKHVRKMVAKLQTHGQQMRSDGLPCLGEGDGLCLPCHTITPGTARSLSPIHITMMRGMEKGLTKEAPSDIRAPLCVDCHAYPATEAARKKGGASRAALAKVLDGDLRFDINYRPCVQPGCHTDRKFEWALTFLGHMKHSVKHVPMADLFEPNRRYDVMGASVNGLVGRSTLKKTGAALPWALIVIMAAAGAFLLRLAAERREAAELFGAESSDAEGGES